MGGSRVEASGPHDHLLSSRLCFFRLLVSEHLVWLTCSRRQPAWYEHFGLISDKVRLDTKVDYSRTNTEIGKPPFCAYALNSVRGKEFRPIMYTKMRRRRVDCCSLLSEHGSIEPHAIYRLIKVPNPPP